MSGKVSNRTKASLRRMAIYMALGLIISPTFNYLTVEPSWVAMGQGMVDVIFILLLLMPYIEFYRPRLERRYFSQMPFISKLIINGCIYVILFHLGRVIGNLVVQKSFESIADTLLTPHMLVSTPFFLVVAVAFQFIIEMNRMVGHNVLKYFITGEYHRPKTEDRIFMFLDLASSTKLTEELGSNRFYALLSEFIEDVTDPVLDTEGEIYQYAGDEVIVTWRMDAGTRNANAIRCYFLIEEVIERKAALYEKVHGTVPKFRAGMHGGRVLAGELGDVKRDIVYVGDVLNTAARLEEFAKDRKLGLVVSKDVMDVMELPDFLQSELVEHFQPRGKTESIDVYRIETMPPL